MLQLLESRGFVAERDINVLFKESANGLYLHSTTDEMRMAMAGVRRGGAGAAPHLHVSHRKVNLDSWIFGLAARVNKASGQVARSNLTAT